MRTTSKTPARRNYLRGPIVASAKLAADKAAVASPLVALARAALTTAFVVGLGTAVLVLLGDANAFSVPSQILSLWARLVDAIQGIVASPSVSCAPVSVGELAASQARMFEGLLRMASGPLARVLGLACLLMGGALAVAKNSPVPAVTGVVNALLLTVVPSVLAGLMGCIVS